MKSLKQAVAVLLWCVASVGCGDASSKESKKFQIIDSGIWSPNTGDGVKHGGLQWIDNESLMLLTSESRTEPPEISPIRYALAIWNDKTKKITPLISDITGYCVFPDKSRVYINNYPNHYLADLLVENNEYKLGKLEQFYSSKESPHYYTINCTYGGKPENSEDSRFDYDLPLIGAKIRPTIVEGHEKYVFRFIGKNGLDQLLDSKFGFGGKMHYVKKLDSYYFPRPRTINDLSNGWLVKRNGTAIRYFQKESKVSDVFIVETGDFYWHHDGNIKGLFYISYEKDSKPIMVEKNYINHLSMSDNNCSLAYVNSDIDQKTSFRSSRIKILDICNK